ncbi:uncharacterized protein TNCV_1288481 [Trichonephila clavipes]|nr:uncharacterized protein TNCV_1288481 [Trichonephila clavipes]
MRSCNRVREDDFFPEMLQKDWAGMYPLCSIIGSSGQGMVLLQRTPGSWRPRGITEKEDHRIRRTAVTHRTASAAEIRVAVGTTLTQQTNRNRLP